MVPIDPYAQALVKWSTMGWWFDIAETEHMKEIMSLLGVARIPNQ
jgi:hypothetical protein